MELTFHSMDELREFLAWRDEQHERALNGERPPVGPYEPVLAKEAPIEPAASGDNEEPPAPEVQVETPKRTRRTKAQIEADRIAAESQQPAIEQQSAPRTELQAEQAAGLLADDTNPWPDEALIYERASHIVADPAAHLKESRDFIAAWGLPAYFETQQAAKVGDNAITYEAGDRARHAAAMQLYAETHNKTGG